MPECSLCIFSSPQPALTQIQSAMKYIKRRKTFWRVPRKKKGVAFGFGQSNVWFARGEDDNKYLSDFLDRLENQIETYDGENWIDRYAE